MIFALPVMCAVIGFSDSWAKTWTAFLHYFVVLLVQKVSLDVFNLLSFSLQSPTLTGSFIKSKGLGCLKIVFTSATPVLSLWFGWYSTISIVCLWILLLFRTGYRGKRVLDRLMSKVSTNNPLDPDGTWIIAVSRRFNLYEVDTLYYNEILPTLKKYGIVLECLYADNSSNSEDYWTTRMGLILELADIHILVEHFPSVAILHEQDYSAALQTDRKRKALLTQLLLGVEIDKENRIDRYMPKPVSIRISPKRNLVHNIFRLHLPMNGGGDKFSAAFNHTLEMATKKMNVLYSQTEIPESLRKSMQGSYPQRKYLATLMQTEETARQLTNNLLQKIKETDDSTIIDHKEYLLSENKYQEFLLRVRAKEKVIPRKYSDTFRLLKRFVFDTKMESLKSEELNESDKQAIDLIKKLGGWLGYIFFHPYVIWLRVLYRKSIIN